MFVTTKQPIERGSAFVRVDGNPVKYCYAADEELGVALCYADPLVKDRATGDAKKVLFEGHVEIIRTRRGGSAPIPQRQTPPDAIVP